MAVATPTPATGADNAVAPIPDPFTLEEIALFFKETGLPEFQRVSVKSLVRRIERWAKTDGLAMRRRGGPGGGPWEVSYTAMLEAHNRRHPAPGQ